MVVRPMGLGGLPVSRLPMRASILTGGLFVAAVAGAQTRIDLRTQVKSVDFSSADSTSPSQTGTQLPATCNIGQSYFKTNAAAGQNWYLCLAGNQWTVQGSTLPALAGNAGTILFTDGNGLFWKGLGGDIGGSPNAVVVNGISGRPLSTIAPQAGQSLAWNGTQWAPASAGGDVAGAFASATVRALQGLPVASGTPQNGQVLTWNGAQWSGQSAMGEVASVFGRTGAVGAQAGDYTAAQITNAADVTAANSYAAGARQSFQGNLAAAGLRYVPSALPANPLAGDLAVDSGDSNQFKVYNGGNWVTLTPAAVPPNYGALFSNQTTVTVPGTSHQLGTANLEVECFDSATPANLVEANAVTINPATYDVNIFFATAQSGYCVIDGSGGSGSGSGGGGASMASQLRDFQVTPAGPNQLAIGVGCSAATPCNARIGGQVYSITSSATATITSGTGMAFVYVDANGVLTVGHSMTVSCVGCTAMGGITSFPPDVIPLFTWQASNGGWITGGGRDLRGWLSGTNLQAGTGMVVVESGGNTTVAVDSAVVPTYLAGSATLSFPAIAAGSCSADLTFSLPGASLGDAIAPGWPGAMPAGAMGMMRVSAAGVVAVRLCALGTAVTLAPATFQAMDIQGQ